MLLNNYEQQGLLFNMNLKESAGSGLQGYRGELVLVEGEVGDSAGRRKPPLAVLKQVVMLAGEDKMKLVAGLVDDVADLSHFFSRYGADVAADGKAIFFVVNVITSYSIHYTKLYDAGLLLFRQILVGRHHHPGPHALGPVAAQGVVLPFLQQPQQLDL